MTRLTRDIGHHSYWSDAYSLNIFAKGFEEEQAAGPIDVITLLEVLEHLPDPVVYLREFVHGHGPRSSSLPPSPIPNNAHVQTGGIFHLKLASTYRSIQLIH